MKYASDPKLICMLLSPMFQSNRINAKGFGVKSIRHVLKLFLKCQHGVHSLNNQEMIVKQFQPVFKDKRL